MFNFKTFLKNGLEEAKITLWPDTWNPSSQARVTSEKSSSDLSSLKEELIFSWKLFQFRQSLSFGETFILERFLKKRLRGT